MVANYSKNGKHNGGSAPAGKAGLYPKGKGKFSANHKYSAASDYNSQHLTNFKGGAFTASGGFSEQKGAAAPAPAPPAPVAATSPSTNYAQFNAQATGNANNEANQMNVNVCAPPLAVEPNVAHQHPPTTNMNMNNMNMMGGGPLLSGPSQPMMNVPTVMNTPNQPAADMNGHQMMIGFNPALIGGFPMFNAPIPCGPAPDQNGGGINPHPAAAWGSGAVAGPRQPQSNQWQNNSFNGNKGRNSYNSSNGGQTHQSDHSYYYKGQHNGLGRAPSSTGAAGKGDSGTDRGINPTNSCKGPHDIADKAPTTSMGNDHDGEYTVMVQNLPADCTVHVLRKLFERSGFPTTEFNYLYLPNEFVSGKHMGYCFVNFRQYKDALRFLDYFNFHKVADFASLAEGAENQTDRAGEVAAEEMEKSGAGGEKAEPETWEVCDTSSWTESKNILKVKKALVQGLSQNLVKLRQNDVLLERMCEKPEWCPLLFNDKGVAVSFSPDCKTPPATEQELTDCAVCSKDNTSSTKETASSSNPAAKQGVHGSGEGELEGINGEQPRVSETGSNHAVPAPPPAVYPTPQQLSQMNAQAPPAPPADYLSTMMKLGPTMPPAPQMPHVPYPMYYPSQLAQFPTLINTNTYPAASTFPAVGTAFIQAPGPMQMPQMQFPLMDPMAFYCPTPV